VGRESGPPCAGELPAGEIDGWLHRLEQWLAETFGIAESTLQVHLDNVPSGQSE